MFGKFSDAGYVKALDKITRKTLVHGATTLMTEFRLEKGAVLPKHRHPHEQTGYLVSGRMEMTIEGEVCTVAPGDSWCIPGNAEHGATAHEYSVAVEVFSPVREDYLPR